MSRSAPWSRTACPGRSRPCWTGGRRIPAIAEWNAELDVSKGAGQTHDFERDPGHYIDIDDAGKVLGGVDFNAPCRCRAATTTRAARRRPDPVRRRIPLLQPDRRLAADPHGFRLDAGADRGPAHRLEPRRPRVLPGAAGSAASAAAARHRRLGPLRGRWQPADACLGAFQRLGQLSEPEQLHQRPDPRAVRRHLRQELRRRAGGPRRPAALSRLRLPDRAARARLSADHAGHGRGGPISWRRRATTTPPRPRRRSASSPSASRPGRPRCATW